MLIVLGHELTYFVKHQTKGTQSYTENEVSSMFEFLIDDTFVEFGGHIFQQTIGIPIATKYVTLLAALFLHSYQAGFLKKSLRTDNER